MNKSYWHYGIGLLLILSSCSVGPDFKKPTPTMPSSWIGSNNTSAEIIKWWENFSDPLLTSLIDRAIQSNLDLKQAVSRVRQARAAKMGAISQFFPTINASGDYTRTGGKRNSQNSGLAAEGVTSLYQAGLDSSWEIDIFGGTRRQVEATGADLVAAQEDQHAVFVSLASEIALNYLALAGTEERIRINQETLLAQQRVVDLTGRRFKAGFANALDTTNASAQVATTQSELPPLQAQQQKYKYALALLLALDPGALENELSKPTILPAVPPQIPVGLPSDLLQRRPDIREAEAAFHAATARVGVATADLFPKFSLTALVGLAGPGISSLGYWKDRSWSLIPGVSLPLFDAGRINATIDIQNELQEQSLLNYQKVVLTALNEVESALVDYSRELEHRAALEKVVLANQKALSLSENLYTSGNAEFLNVLVAQKALYSAQDAMGRSETQVRTNLVVLYKALGGGWETAQ